MKILATGDLHGDVKRSKDLADLAAKEKVDLVLLGGDLVNSQRDPTNMIGPFKQKNLKVGFVWGNHDGPELADFWQNAYKITSLHGYGFMVGDVGFFGCGGANVGLEQLSEEEIFAYLKKGFDKVKNAKVKVMITHVHPSGTIAEKFSSFFKGSKGVRKAIEDFEPDLHLTCHVHEAEGIEDRIGKTKIMHIGRNGKIIDI